MSRVTDFNFRRLLISGAQYSVAIAAVGWIVLQTEWQRAIALLIDIDAIVILLVLAVTVGEFCSRFLMWHVLFNAVNRTRFSSAVNVDLVIRFINQLLPSRLSGRSVAPLVVRHYTAFDWSDAVALAGVHTGMHAVIYGMVSLIGLVFVFAQLSVGLGLVIALSTGLYLVAGLTILLAGRQLAVLDGLVNRVHSMVTRFPRLGTRMTVFLEKVPEFTSESAGTFRSLTGSIRLWIPYGIGWVGKLMVFPAVRVSLLLASLGSSFEPLLLLPFVLVMAYSVTLLPLTPGGIGVAEASAVLVFNSLGVPHEVIVPVILIDRILGVYLAAVAGGYPMANLDIRDLIPSG